MRLKNLLTFLVLLSVSLGMRAADFTWTSSDGQYTVTAENLDAGWHDIGYGNKNYEATQILKVNKAGALAAFVADTKNLSGNSLMGVGGNTSRQILQIQGSMSSDDFAAMNSSEVARWGTFTTIDLAQVTVSTAADVQSMNMGNAETIILPNSFTKAEVNEAGAAFAEANSNFGSCISLKSETTPQVTTHYWYTDENNNQVEINESDVVADGDNLSYSYQVQRSGTSELSDESGRFWYEYNGQEYPLTETEYVNNTAMTITNTVVDVTKTTKYYKQAADGGNELQTHEMQLIDDVYYYGGSWQDNVYVGGTPAVLKDVYTYNDNGTTVTLETVPSGTNPSLVQDDGDGTYSATVSKTVQLTKTTKYYKQDADGGTEVSETYEQPIIDGVLYYGGHWEYNPTRYVDGKAAVSKDVFTYTLIKNYNSYTYQYGEPVSPGTLPDGVTYNSEDNTYSATVNDVVDVNKAQKYFTEGDVELQQHEMVQQNGVYYYGGTYQRVYVGGKEAEVKDVYTYTDPSDNQTHTLTVDAGTVPESVTDDGDGTYSANITLANPQTVPTHAEYTYSYTDQNNETQTVTFTEKQAEGATYTYNYDVTVTAPVTTTETSADVTSTSVTAYVNKAGTLYKATNMAYMYDGLEALKKDNSTNDVISAIETVVISGNVTLDDISQASANHADPFPSVEKPAPDEPIDGEGKFTVDANTYHPAFYINNAGAPIKDLDLSSAIIDDPVYLRTVSNNSALERIVFPDNLTRIPYACCYANGTSGNYKLKDIVFPQGLTEIGAYAFHDVAIKELYVTNQTTTIGWEAFGSCKQLEDLVFQAGLTDLSYSGYVFDSCTGLKHVIFPEGVTNIGNYIFNMCTSLESIHLPSSLLTIGDGAFHECHSIRTLVIPENVRSIGKAAFALCYIEDLFLMAEDVDHLPVIYSAGSDFTSSNSTFAINQLEGNDTSIPENYDDYLTYSSDQMLELYRQLGHGGGNTITYIHYSPNVAAFIDANPYYYNPDYKVKDSEKELLSDTYVYVDKEGHRWPSKDSNHWVDGIGRVDARGNGEFAGDYHRCGILGDPTTYQSTNESAWNYSPYATTSIDEPSKLAWRQFALRRGDAHDETVVIYKEYKDVWYTFCTPFDMTDEMLAVAFNENFNICEFDGVEVKDESIILHFNTIATSVYKDQNEVVYEDLGKDETDFHTFRFNGETYTHVEVSAMPNTPTYAKDGNVENGVKVIQGFLATCYHPYMIHPNIGSMQPKKKAITGEYKDLKQINANTTLCSKTEFNTLSHAVKKTATYGNVSGDFYFIGNVDEPSEMVETGDTRTVFSGDITPGNMVKTITGGANVTLGNKLIPQYAYFLGTAPGDTYPKYWKETASNDRASGGIWSQYSAIIISDQKIEKALGRTTNLQDNPIKSLEIDFSAFNPDEITAIEQIVEEARENNEPVQYLNIVYDFNGNIVKKGDTSLENLPGGMYIVNGKKYLVK